MDSNATLILSLVALIVMSAFFSASETAFTSLNRVRVKNMAQAGNKRAEKVLKFAENYDQLISGILIGNNIVNILSASLATVLFVNLIGNAGVSVSTIVMTIIVLMFGEITPKSIAKDHPEKIALAFYPILNVILKILTPLVYLFSRWQKLTSRLFKPSNDRGITEEELITIVEEAQNEGEIDEHESEIIRSAIGFNDLCAEDILTPRVDIIAVEVDDDNDSVAEAFANCSYSRLPVYDDNMDNIIGVLHEKDFYKFKDQKHIRDIMSAPLCVMPATHLSALLKLFQRTKHHLAVVMDEYGGVSGIVTMEDILEELVGEIWDEHDEIVEDITVLEDGSHRVSGSASLDDLQDIFPIPQNYDCVTVNGWVLEVLGRFPQPEDTFDFGQMHVTIEKVDKRRVTQIRIEKLIDVEKNNR